MKVLIIDDEPSTRNLSSDFLDLLGMDNIAVSSIEEAIEVSAKEEIGLLIIDFYLEEEVNGLQAYQKYSEVCGACDFIIVTGKNMGIVRDALRMMDLAPIDLVDRKDFHSYFKQYKKVS